MAKHHKEVKNIKEENIYNSAYIQELEKEYCCSRSAVVSSCCLVSSRGLGARLMSHVYNGGRRVVYTATMGAMLANNMAIPAYGAGDITVSSGQTWTGIVQGFNLYNYGTTVNTTIYTGSEYIYNNALAISTIIRGGDQAVSSGGVANDVSVFGGSQYIYSGGVANNATVSSYGVQCVYNGGIANSTTLNNNGYQYVKSGGVANRTIINDFGSQYISSGGVANYATVDAGGQNVGSSAVANYTTINRGRQDVFSGGVANYTTVNGGMQEVHSDGTANNTIVNADGRQFIAGGVANNTIISGGSQNIQASGVANYTTMSGGSQTIMGGGVANNTTMYGGKQNIGLNGTASGTIISAGGSQVISYGGTVSNTTIYSGSQIISAGVADTTVVSANGRQIIKGGTANDTSVYGRQMISTGTANNTTIYSGGVQALQDGAVANNTIIENGGIQSNHPTEDGLNDGGIMNNTSIHSGGSQVVGNSGEANYTNIYKGGSQVINNGGLAVSTTISSGGNQYIYSGGIDSDTTISTGGKQYIYNSGLASSTTVSSGGVQYVSAGGSSINTIQSSGGNINVSVTNDGTYVLGTNQSGAQFSLENGIASNFIINKGGWHNVLAGGSSLDIIQNIGGNINVSVANDGTYITGTNQSGVQFSLTNGVASNFIINSGGWQKVLNGGSADKTTVNSGGSQVVSNGGRVTSTTINGGLVTLYGNGHLEGLTGTNGTLNISGTNTLSGNINLTGTNVNIAQQTGGTTLTINNLSANDAVFNMNVDLVEQTGDQLNITGTYNGNAYLSLNNVGATATETTGNGIPLVVFGNESAGSGTFALQNGHWDVDAYTYVLDQGVESEGDRNYYLRTGDYSDTFKTMLNMPVMNVIVAQTGMNSLQRRMGDLIAMDRTGAHSGIWVRTYYKNMEVKDLIKTDMSLFGAEAGYDWLFKADEPTKLYAGVMLGFVNAPSIKTAKDIDNRYDKGSGEAPSVGIYATIVNDENWFVDIAARNFWTKLDMKSYPNGMVNALEYSPKRDVLAASIEVGKNIRKEAKRNGYIRIEPKAELGVMRASGSEVTVNDASKLKYDGANYANIKAGVLLSYNTQMENGLLIEPLMELAYRYELLGKDKVTYSGVTEESNLKGGTLEIDAGLNMQLAENLYWYGVGSYEQSSKVSGWGLHAGIRYDIGGSTNKTSVSKKKTSKKKTKKGKEARLWDLFTTDDNKAETKEQNIVADKTEEVGLREDIELGSMPTVKEKEEISDQESVTGKDSKPKRYKVVNGEKIEQ